MFAEPTLPIVLRSKLRRPRVSRNAITRTRLLNVLDHLSALTLVVAPAGYGKTTLVSMWLEQRSHPSAWLSLEEKDDHLAEFLIGFVISIRNVVPDFGDDLLGVLTSPNLPGVDVIARMLTNGLDALPHDLIVVLDDYHTISDPSIHALIMELLRFPPRPLHLVITARQEPPFALARERAYGRVVEIRASHLRFTHAEVKALLKESVNAPVDEQVVERLIKQTDGWVASLHFTLLYLRQRQDAVTLQESVAKGVHYSIEYLTTEVLARFPATLQAFLAKTSILERMCGSLCDAVCADSISHVGTQTLHWLEESGVFTTALIETTHLVNDMPKRANGDQTEWFQLHPLFRQLMEQQLHRHYSSGEIAELHRRASAWHLAHGLIEDAVQHAVAAGDLRSAIEIVARFRPSVMNQEQWYRLAHWLRLFPQETIEEQPELLMMLAWVTHQRYQISKVAAILARVEALLAARKTHPAPEMIMDAAGALRLEGEIEILRTYFSYWNGDMTGVLAHGESALAKTPHELWGVRLLAIMFLSGFYQATGNLTKAYALYDEHLAEGSSAGVGYQIRLLTAMTFFRFIAGDLASLMKNATQILAWSKEHYRAESVGFAAYFLAAVHYHHDNLAAAEQALCDLIPNRYRLALHCVVQSAFVLSLTYQAQGREEEARKMAAFALAHSTEVGNMDLAFTARAFQAELALRQGRLADADFLARELGCSPLPQMPLFYAPHITLARLFLTQNTPESMERARTLLRSLHTFAESTRNVYVFMEVLALETMLHQAHGDEQAALASLERAIELARPGGYIRLFADLAPALDRPLSRLAQRGVASIFVASIRAASERTRSAQSSIAPTVTKARYIDSDIAAVLTYREQDVLALLERRLTNQEIAAALNISQETVKRHTVSLFRKLQVTNRREAVVQAQVLGLLTPNNEHS